MKWELEDLAFKALEPERFRELAKLLDTRRKGRETYIERAIAELPPQARGGRHQGRHRGPPEAHLQHLEEDAAQERRVRRDLRRLRHPHPGRRGPRLLRGARHRPLALAPDPGPVRRLHRGPQEQPLPVAPHRGRSRIDGKPLEIQIRTHADAPGRPRSASPPTGATRRAPSPTASTTPSSPGCASSWTGSATSRVDATEFVEGIKLDIFQDQVFVFTPKGDIKDLPAGATPLDFAYRIHTDVGHRTIGAEGQQPARAARLPAQERRHRRDRDDQGRARPVARLAERRPDQPRPREDPPMVQAQGPRREHRPRPRVARARAAGAWRGRRSRRSGHEPIAEVAQHYNYDIDRRLLRRHRLRRDQRPDSGHAPRASSTTSRARCRPSRRRSSSTGPAASGSRASATCSSGSPSAATRSRATRSSGSSPAARA